MKKEILIKGKVLIAIFYKIQNMYAYEGTQNQCQVIQN